MSTPSSTNSVFPSTSFNPFQDDDNGQHTNPSSTGFVDNLAKAAQPLFSPSNDTINPQPPPSKDIQTIPQPLSSSLNPKIEPQQTGGKPGLPAFNQRIKLSLNQHPIDKAYMHCGNAGYPQTIENPNNIQYVGNPFESIRLTADEPSPKVKVVNTQGGKIGEGQLGPRMLPISTTGPASRNKFSDPKDSKTSSDQRGIEAQHKVDRKQVSEPIVSGELLVNVPCLDDPHGWVQVSREELSLVEDLMRKTASARTKR
jgi:hypothetical protein